MTKFMASPSGELVTGGRFRFPEIHWNHGARTALIDGEPIAYERLRVQPMVIRALRGGINTVGHLHVPLHVFIGSRLRYSVDGGPWGSFYRGFEAEDIVAELHQHGVDIVRPVKYGRVRDTTMTGAPRQFGNGTCR